MSTYSATYSLKLTDLMVPGFEGYTPPFGTKVSTGTSLTPMQVQENMQLPYQTIGCIEEISGSSLASASSGDTVNIAVTIERNAIVKMTNCTSGVTYAITLSGTSTMPSNYLLFGLITDGSGSFKVQSTQYTTSSSTIYWFLVKYSSGTTTVTKLTSG